MQLLYFEGVKDLAVKLAKRIRVRPYLIEQDYFPDGEVHIRLPSKIAKEVIILDTFYPNPNEALLRLNFAIETLKEFNTTVTVAAPYLGFMRQDKRFKKNEAVSSRIMGKLLGKADKVITVDPHLHRYKSIKKVLKKGVSITANHLIEEYIKANYKDAVIIGPDGESYQWARRIAEDIGGEATIMQKRRLSGRKVKVTLKGNVNIKNKKVLFIDDIVSTGHTIVEASRILKRLGARSFDVISIHGLFVENAVKKLRDAGVNKIVCTNSIKSRYSRIDISGLIADTL